MLLRIALLLCIAAPLTGCATILSGRTQSVAVETAPANAKCNLVRKGQIVASIESTPGAAMVDKTKHDIDVVCTKDGYSESKGFAESGIDSFVFGNFVLGGLIGWGVDSAVGADNRYPEKVLVNLTAKETQAPRAALAVVAPTDTTTSELKKKLLLLEQLRKDGVLTEDEYQRKRAEAISGI